MINFFQKALDIFRELEYYYIRSEALSPNGKALDSDSSIFQVRILVALHKTAEEFSSAVFLFGKN